MAIPAQGFTFTWRGTALSEIRTLAMSVAKDAGGDVLRSRSGEVIAADIGTISLGALSPTAMSHSEYGRYGTLRITVPIAGTATMAIFEGICNYDGMAAQASVNEAVSFAYRFSVWSMTKGLSTT